jgi:epoxyqueuosine reductase
MLELQKRRDTVPTVDQQREQLQQTALELGFDAAAWVGALVPARDIGAFQTWIDAGMHAGMDYLPRSVARRSDLSSSFAGTKSVLVLMVSHNHAEPETPTGGTRVGRVARYAWSRDYHTALKPFLSELERASLALGVQAKAYVDHGLMLERSLASRAGLGWRGRSSQIISQALGALTTLAVLLTDLEPPEETFEHLDRCGKCTACVRDCPTNAITPDRFVDARRCLSYYTIEHRGSIPLEFRAGLGNHLFGCDDCLDVCPWTKHAGRFSSLLTPEPDLAHPDLEPFFTLSSNHFEKRFAGTAFSRARRKGMARNAALVLGNTRDASHIDLLELGLNDVGVEVRESCAWALGRFNLEIRVETALTRALQDTDIGVSSTARTALNGKFQ